MKWTLSLSRSSRRPLGLACFLFGSLVGLSGCQPKSASGSGELAPGECASASDCSGGEVCLDGACYRVCQQHSDCGEQEHCSADGVCVSGYPEGVVPPVISGVDGTGSLDGSEGHADRHIHDRIIVEGEHLSGAKFSLRGVDPVSEPQRLERCGAGTDTRVALGLPPSLDSLGEGTYALSAVNEAGQCDATLRILQGESGSLEASAFDIIDSVNAETQADAQLRLYGTLESETGGDLVSTLSARASARTLGNAQLRVNRQVYPESAPMEPGFYLVVVDLGTHSVSEHGFYPASDGSAPQQLNDVLSGLSAPNHVALLASAGSSSALSSFAGFADLRSTIQQFGGSGGFSRLGVDEPEVDAGKQSYVLIGAPGLGAGNGVEQLAGTERNQEAEVTTVAVDQTVIGFLDRTVDTTRIANNSIRSVDIEDESLTGDDVDDGSIRAADTDFVVESGETLTFGEMIDVSPSAGTASIGGALTVNGNVEINGVDAVSHGSFTISGADQNTFCPVRFQNAAPGNSVSNDLMIYRDNVHDDGSWKGTFFFRLSFHPTNYGHFHRQIETIHYQTGINKDSTDYLYHDPVGHIADGSGRGGGSDLIVWLRGGGATYQWRGLQSRAPWRVLDANTNCDSITDSSGKQRDPRSSQSGVIRNAKNNFYTHSVGLATKRNIETQGSVIVGGSTVHSSDARLKRDINVVSDALERIEKVNGVTWKWKDERVAGTHMGVVAQDVEKAAPELVREVDGHKTVNYNGLNAVTIEAIKELKARTEVIKSLQARIEKLEKQQTESR